MEVIIYDYLLHASLIDCTFSMKLQFPALLYRLPLLFFIGIFCIFIALTIHILVRRLTPEIDFRVPISSQGSSAFAFKHNPCHFSIFLFDRLKKFSGTLKTRSRGPNQKRNSKVTRIP